MDTHTYKAEYGNSYALIIGINSYQSCSPLSYATHDAEEVAEVLKKEFSFPKENIHVLLDKSATKGAILSNYLKFAQDKSIMGDDRLVVFFAGHGLTKRSSRGDVGYLVPVDGKPEDITTLIRWDELTRNADLVLTKHVFFLMDACYGGLAFIRQPSFGKMRFLRDMLRRPARQVLTAGKADEVVADGNGVRPGHSIFTAHLLNALEGAAATSDGLVTANSVMAYVYEKVGGDQYSHQTPHFGFIDGDGDFIFNPSILEKLIGLDDENPTTEGQKGEKDILINTSSQSTVTVKEEEIVETMKELLSDPSKKIKLNDFIDRHVRSFLEKTDSRNFPVQNQRATNESFVERVKNYEDASEDLQKITILLTRWGNPEQLALLRKIFVRIAEADRGSAGLVIWLNLSWYPIQLIMYSAGITAISENNYYALKIILETPIYLITDNDGKPTNINRIVSKQLAEISSSFKALPGLDKHYVPRSEHLFKILQPMLEDLLFLGRSYEEYFDKFEIFTAWSFIDNDSRNQDIDAIRQGWAPTGRFGWKFSSLIHGNPVKPIINEAEKEKEQWPPIEAGFFRSSRTRFLAISKAFSDTLSRLNWS